MGTSVEIEPATVHSSQSQRDHIYLLFLCSHTGIPYLILTRIVSEKVVRSSGFRLTTFHESTYCSRHKFNMGVGI